MPTHAGGGGAAISRHFPIEGDGCPGRHISITRHTAHNTVLCITQHCTLHYTTLYTTLHYTLYTLYPPFQHKWRRYWHSLRRQSQLSMSKYKCEKMFIIVVLDSLFSFSKYVWVYSQGGASYGHIVFCNYLLSKEVCSAVGGRHRAGLPSPGWRIWWMPGQYLEQNL